MATLASRLIPRKFMIEITGRHSMGNENHGSISPIGAIMSLQLKSTAISA
jgi:hypothetical protein